MPAMQRKLPLIPILSTEVEIRIPADMPVHTRNRTAPVLLIFVIDRARSTRKGRTRRRSRYQTYSSATIFTV